MTKVKDFVIGQSVLCDVPEILSILDHEGIVIEVEESTCLIRFSTKTKRINKIALRPR
tara:strand:+ start:353 stop:526 length:174 start_codon:yes stop_codon:yes gene_type:complete